MNDTEQKKVLEISDDIDNAIVELDKMAEEISEIYPNFSFRLANLSLRFERLSREIYALTD